MRRYAMWLGLVCMTGCASLTRPLGAERDPETGEYETPKQETVYLVPAEDAMMMTRLILEEQRYDVLEKEGGLEMYTSAHEPGNNQRGLRTIERYYIKGERLGPRQTLVRVFRLSYNEMDRAVEYGSAGLKELNRKLFIDENEHPFDANKTFKTAPDLNGPGRLMDMDDPFKDAPEMERFQLVRGNRDLDIERTLLERLEMVPSLELVGGNTSVPARSVVLEGWSESGESAQAPAPECGTPVDGAAPLLAQGQTLLLADPLGTRELPSAALRMLCEASAKGLSVTLAVSLPVTEQKLLDTYLASAGSSQDAQELLSGSSFWRRVHQDGRSSRAMLWLVEHARRLRASGRSVSLVAFDAEKATGNEREAQMAQRLLDYRSQNPDAFLLVLAGGAHVRTTNAGRGGDFEPLGMRLAKTLPSVKALDVGFTRGTQFSCRYNVWDAVECNVFAISPTKQARQASTVSPGVQLFAQPLEEGFHGRLYVGPLSASPPALMAGTTVSAAPDAAK
ncbi:hypothetical protein HPC49_19990 [Pyxidicoccus fallax]|uniref:ChaN family lipoprotein n=1 Tax=Pyxidicoccus fallax TaxID=394095 RepID=A0A848LCZ9_9BACT|nr:hypothetical protein [Pyxidicoccus fallax]NMO14685.1 ChaN family lipoprotein [Pyxidicoccus fallax]NPC80493.1 hypothetical protein [Pyxidicoccus fallax]